MPAHDLETVGLFHGGHCRLDELATAGRGQQSADNWRMKESYGLW
jgi:hypothetical protein